ncbi:MAG: hypothetical protein AAGG48_14045 [Planctomycetota bacterium]
MATRICLTIALLLLVGVANVAGGLMLTTVGMAEREPIAHQQLGSQPSAPQDHRVLNDGDNGDAGIADSGIPSVALQLWSEYLAVTLVIDLQLTDSAILTDISLPPDPELGGLIKPPRMREI